MNDNQTATTTEFTLRRLSEGFTVFGWELPSWLWVFFLLIVLAAGIAYVIVMYVKDSRSVHWAWAILLAGLRSTVYGVLALVFLLPSCQTWERAEKRSRVVIVIDVSDSIGRVTDDIPGPDKPVDKLETRLDKLLRFLSDENVAFLSRLMEKNPAVVYRFGARLDEETQQFVRGEPNWGRDEWKSWLKLDFKFWALQGLSEPGRRLVQDTAAFEADKPGTAEWAINWIRKDESETFPPPESGFSEDDRKKLKENRDKLDKRVEVVRQLLQGTNVGDSVLSVINREANNMVQGVVVFSDGRSTHGAELVLQEIRQRAKREPIPVFTVIVGEDRLPISIQIVDVQTPEQAPPNEKFVIRPEIDGIGLPGAKKPVYLDIFQPGDDPKKAKPIHTIEGEVTFQPGEPPHGQVEFSIDPTATEGKDKLPQELFKSAADVAKEKSDGKEKPKEEPKSGPANVRELIEGEWKFTVRVPKDDGEAFLDKEHKSDVVAVQIVKKPIRVLLFAGGPTRDFQFVRTMFVREKDQKRAEVSVFLQNEGRDGRDVQDVEPERRLSRFPTTLLLGEAAAKMDPKEKYYNLDQYDVIIAFDPDWSELLPEQFNLLKTWVENQAGGLIIVAGPVHTYQVASAEEGGKFKVLQELFPVIPGDSRLPLAGGVRRNTKKPWYLNFPGAKDQEFLKLDDDKNHPLAGWDEFFFRKERRDERDTEAKNGFYDFYPVQSAKKGADVVATFADPAAKLPDGSEHPYLVTMDYPKGKIIYLGGEMYRMRSRKIEYYERFWVKLARYASAGTRVRGSSKRGVLVMGKQFSAGNFVRLEAQMFGPDSNPLPETVEVKGFISPLNNSDPKARKEIRLSPKRSSVTWGGWFQGRHLVENPGEYQIEIPIPNSPDALRGKILVKESNPELDMVRPDFRAMYQMASDIDDVMSRITDKSVADRLQKAVGQRRVRSETPSGAKSDDVEPVADRGADKPRLFFDLHTAEVIPDCMLALTEVQKNKGKIDDLWDKGIVLGYDSHNTPIRLPFVLFGIVGLLSMEWLIRKLLRLA